MEELQVSKFSEEPGKETKLGRPQHGSTKELERAVLRLTYEGLTRRGDWCTMCTYQGFVIAGNHCGTNCLIWFVVA